MMDSTLQAIGVGLILTAVVNAFIQLFANNQCFQNLPCRVPGPLGGSMDSIYENYAVGMYIVNGCCGVPSSILLLISGILCITGPVLGILISNSITSILLVVIIIVAIMGPGSVKCWCCNGKCGFGVDDVDCTNWGINFGAQFVGIILSITASMYSILQLYSSE